MAMTWVWAEWAFRGKPFGFYPTDNCGRTYYTIQFQGVNDKGFGGYADGFVPQNANFQFGARTPGCQVADQLVAPLGTTSTAEAHRPVYQPKRWQALPCGRA